MLGRIARSFRDWGRDCYCAGGESNTCGTRFSQQFGTLPHGFDHKYVYSHIGYNLKVTDMQAAIGCAQLGKLDGFIARRRANFDRLMRRAAAVRGPADPARSHPGLGAVLVRVCDHGARARRLHARRPGPVPRGQPRRDAQPVCGQPAPPSGLSRHSAPRRPRSGQHRPVMNRHVLRRRLSRASTQPRLDHMVSVFDRFMRGERVIGVSALTHGRGAEAALHRRARSSRTATASTR